MIHFHYHFPPPFNLGLSISSGLQGQQRATRDGEAGHTAGPMDQRLNEVMGKLSVTYCQPVRLELLPFASAQTPTI